MNVALILAGGNGTRMGSATPKQFLPLAGKPLILHALAAFEQHPQIHGIVIVSGEDWSGRVKYLVEQAGMKKVKAVVSGGATRRESSFRGLSALRETYSDQDIVLIHDAARPLVSGALISRCITATETHGACTAAIPARDTILVSVDGKTTERIPDRNTLYAVQTPQAFRLGAIYEAHRSYPAKLEATDDAGILVAQGHRVGIAEGEVRNLKVTSVEDLVTAEALLGSE